MFRRGSAGNTQQPTHTLPYRGMYDPSVAAWVQPFGHESADALKNSDRFPAIKRVGKTALHLAVLAGMVGGTYTYTSHSANPDHQANIIHSLQRDGIDTFTGEGVSSVASLTELQVAALTSDIAGFTRTDTPESEPPVLDPATIALHQLRDYIRNPEVGLMRPETYTHGSFVGAIKMNYGAPRDSELIRGIDARYEQAMGDAFTIPNENTQNVLSLHAMADPAGGHALLDEGAVVDTISSAHAPVVAVHNISKINSKTNINGYPYESSKGGLTGVLAVGDTLSVVVPDAHIQGLVHETTYMLQSEADIAIVQTRDDELYIDQDATFDDAKLILYWCYPPGQETYRLRMVFTRFDVTTYVGTVSDNSNPENIIEQPVNPADIRSIFGDINAGDSLAR